MWRAMASFLALGLASWPTFLLWASLLGRLSCFWSRFLACFLASGLASWPAFWLRASPSCLLSCLVPRFVAATLSLWTSPFVLPNLLSRFTRPPLRFTQPPLSFDPNSPFILPNHPFQMQPVAASSNLHVLTLSSSARHATRWEKLQGEVL